MEESLKLLATSNERLTAEVVELKHVREELATMKLSFEPVQQRAIAAEEELSAALADKSALEQELQLSAAQNAAKRRTLLISTVPKAVCVIWCVISMPFMFMSMLGALPAYYLFPIYYGVGCALLLGVMSIRPTDVLAIRAVSVACCDAAAQNILINSPVAVVIMMGHPTDHIQPGWGPYRPFNMLVAGVMFSLAAGWGWGFILKPMNRLKNGRTLRKCVNRDLWKWTRGRYGPVMSFIYLFLNPGGPGLVWGVKEGADDQFVVPARLALARINLFFRLLFLSGLIVFGGFAVGVLIVQKDILNEEEHWWAWFNVYLTVAGGPLFLIMSTPVVRGKFHAFLGRLASSGEAGRAAGIAALVGKSDVHKVLFEARRAFMGVPFGKMQ